MSKLVSDLELLGAKIEELAKAAGRKVEEVYEEIVAHIDGKTAAATAGVSHSVEDPTHSHSVGPQPGDLAGTIGSVTAANAPAASASASASTETASTATDTAASTETAPAASTEAPAGEAQTAADSANAPAAAEGTSQSSATSTGQ